MVRLFNGRGRGRGRGTWGRPGAAPGPFRPFRNKSVVQPSGQPNSRHIPPTQASYSAHLQQASDDQPGAAMESLLHDAAEAELVALLSIPATQKLSVYLPFTPLFTAATATDRRLREADQSGSVACAKSRSLGESGRPEVNAMYTRWDCLPPNPLCLACQDVEATKGASLSTPHTATLGPSELRYRTEAAVMGSTSTMSTSYIGDREAVNESTALSSSNRQCRRRMERGNATGGDQQVKKSVPVPSSAAAATSTTTTTANVNVPSFHCDACQKSFATAELLATHQTTHLYCTEPGCHFSCKQDRPWKMEEHVQLLHRRANAPDLLDTDAYLAQRRRRYPTQAQVQSKVEELYYKAARGVFLPGERRQWLRQHGVRVMKRPRDGAFYVVRKGEEHTAIPPASTQLPTLSPLPPVPAPSSSAAESTSKAELDGDGETQTDVQAAQATEVSGACLAQDESCSSQTRSAGLTAETTPLVQVTVSPSHPAKVPAALEANEADKVTCSVQAESDGTTHDVAYSRAGGDDAACESDTTTSSDAPPTPQAAHTIISSNTTTKNALSATCDSSVVEPSVGNERTKIVAPVAAAKLAQGNDKRHRQGGRGTVNGRLRKNTAATTTARVSLYEQLTEEDRLIECGLMLQAIHFFVTHDFLRDHE